MAMTITNSEELRKFLEENGWEPSYIFFGLYGKEIRDKGIYFETMSKKTCTYGIDDSVRCEMEYPLTVVDDYQPCEMVWHKVIEQNGIKIRLDE